MRTVITIAVAIAVTFVLAPAAEATLIGDDIVVTWFSPNLGSVFAGPDVITVVDGGSPEIECVGNGGGTSTICGGGNFFTDASFDFGASSITYDQIPGPFYGSAAFNGFEFSDLDWTDGPGRVVGFTLTTGIAGLDPSRVTFGDDFVRVNMEGLGTGRFVVDLDVEHVPEPGVLSLVGIGLLGFALRRFRA